MNWKKLAAACVLLTALSVGAYGYVTYTPGATPTVIEDIAPITSDIAPELESDIPDTVFDFPLDIPKMSYPQKTRVTGRVVYVSPGGSLGCGVVIDKRTVLTVAHMVKAQKMVMVDVGKFERKWVPAIVIGKIRAIPEDIAILKIVTEDYFPDIDHFKLGAGIPLPMLMVTTKGVFAWNPGVVIPGDSGGAVLNIDGELIGLVVGYKIVGKRGVAVIFR